MRGNYDESYIEKYVWFVCRLLVVFPFVFGLVWFVFRDNRSSVVRPFPSEICSESICSHLGHLSLYQAI